MSASVPAPPEVVSTPGAHLPPSHLRTLPVCGACDTVSTSDNELIFPMYAIGLSGSV